MIINGGDNMILEEIANIFEAECKAKGLRNVSKIAGVSKSTISSIINGCGFNLNVNFIAGLSALGYELKLVKKQK
jgi:hypothetical protein